MPLVNYCCEAEYARKINPRSFRYCTLKVKPAKEQLEAEHEELQATDWYGCKKRRFKVYLRWQLSISEAAL